MNLWLIRLAGSGAVCGGDSITIIGLTFAIAVQLGTRGFKLDRQTAILIGTGSAICGAAAVLAAEPVVRGDANRVSVAVATVVVFGTVGMIVYPMVYPHLGLSQQAYGIYAGSTIHEVAQVVAAAKSVGDSAAATAVIEKMVRVMMLGPFLLLLSGAQPGEDADPRNGVAVARAPRFIPWFAVLFVVTCAVNSLHILPAAWVKVLIQVDSFVLAMAMAALGLRTHVGAIRQAGLRPLLLGMTLFGFLTVGGYGINRLVSFLLD